MSVCYSGDLDHVDDALAPFQTEDEGDERVRASYGKNFDRLVAQ